MPTRVPLDVDLEDRLLYGLTPTRLIYLVIALLAAFALWSGRWAAAPLRMGVAIAITAIGTAAAWGRWRGRPLDGWATDIFTYVSATYRVRVRPVRVRKIRFWSR